MQTENKIWIIVSERERGEFLDLPNNQVRLASIVNYDSKIIFSSLKEAFQYYMDHIVNSINKEQFYIISCQHIKPETKLRPIIDLYDYHQLTNVLPLI